MIKAQLPPRSPIKRRNEEQLRGRLVTPPRREAQTPRRRLDRRCLFCFQNHVALSSAFSARGRSEAKRGRARNGYPGARRAYMQERGLRQRCVSAHPGCRVRAWFQIFGNVYPSPASLHPHLAFETHASCACDAKRRGGHNTGTCALAPAIQGKSCVFAASSCILTQWCSRAAPASVHGWGWGPGAKTAASPFADDKASSATAGPAPRVLFSTSALQNMVHVQRCASSSLQRVWKAHPNSSGRRDYPAWFGKAGSCRVQFLLLTLLYCSV